MNCAYFVLFFQSCSESYMGGHYFTCQKYFASAIFAQGTPLLYGACSFNHLLYSFQLKALKSNSQIARPFFEFLTRFSNCKSDWSMKSRKYAYQLRNHAVRPMRSCCSIDRDQPNQCAPRPRSLLLYLSDS